MGLGLSNLISLRRLEIILFIEVTFCHSFIDRNVLWYSALLWHNISLGLFSFRDFDLCLFCILRDRLLCSYFQCGESDGVLWIVGFLRLLLVVDPLCLLLLHFELFTVLGRHVCHALSCCVSLLLEGTHDVLHLHTLILLLLHEHLLQLVFDLNTLLLVLLNHFYLTLLLFDDKLDLFLALYLLVLHLLHYVLNGRLMALFHVSKLLFHDFVHLGVRFVHHFCDNLLGTDARLRHQCRLWSRLEIILASARASSPGS